MDNNAVIEVKVPEMGESITEGTIARWAVREGEHVQPGDVLVEVETDKVNMEIPAVSSGVVSRILKQEGENVQIGEAIAQLTPQGASEPPAAAAVALESVPAAAESALDHDGDGGNAESSVSDPVLPQQRPGAIPGSPSRRRYEREHGSGRGRGEAVQPTEAGGSHATAPMSAAASTVPASSVAAVAHGQAEESRPVERIRMSRRRQTIAARLVEAQHNAAMLTTFNEIDMSAVMDVRSRRKDAFLEKHGVKLGFMSFFTKAVIGALKAYPLINAELDGQDLIVKKYYDIGIAVSTEGGLVVPVIHDADRLSLAGIEKALAELAGKARDNRLQLSDLEGGTFTITNGGVFGSLLSTPILNPPQTGILGMHKIQTRPVTVDGDGIANRPMMYIALSYDHRVVDGREAVGFLVRVKELLEDPESLWFDL